MMYAGAGYSALLQRETNRNKNTMRRATRTEAKERRIQLPHACMTDLLYTFYYVSIFQTKFHFPGDARTRCKRLRERGSDAL